MVWRKVRDIYIFSILSQMRSFVKKNILFALLMFGVAFIFDCVITLGLQKSDLRMYQAWNDIFKSKINGDAIILGSSRAWCQYSPEILDSITGLNFYNLGIDGHKIDFQLIRYNTYRRFCPKPKYIIHNVEFSTLGLTIDGYEREQFFPYICDDSLINAVAKIKKITQLERKIPLVRYFGYRHVFEDGIKYFFGGENLYEGGMVKGYRGNDYEWDGFSLEQIERINYDNNQSAIKMFDEYLSNAKAEGIEIILVFAPLYIDAFNLLSDYNSLLDLYHSIADNYNFRVLDYTCIDLSLSKSNFYNATHLNKQGAEKFSLILGNDLKRLISN